MIQDIFPHKLNNQYDPSAVAAPEDYALCFQGGKLLMRENTMLRVRDFPAETKYTYLLSLDDTRFFLARGTENTPEDCEFVDTRTLRGSNMLPQHIVFAVMTGKHLSDWYRDVQFCGRCGEPMTHSDRERAMKCACGYTAYPRIMPAVIVGVKNGDKLLLTKYRTGFAHNALIAGFTEIGETLEETVAREVMEEAGVKVKNITYYKSQPWGVANDILVGYYCEVDGDPTIHMDPGELKYADWVQREEIVLQPDNFSLTNEMMTMFKTGKVQ